ncbi:hypothetical protein [uncultured Roseovarius sp.]|uniref:hypothetical protein n=1 Tax=uncultured Roseovarius sp. TaxID=293344 RepID=UPI002605D878|nr:hypothetical protein [uncultured Roseovarius sp.]
MKHARDLSGQMPVGHMAEMDGISAMAVACLRAWNQGGAMRAHAMLCERMTEPMATASFEALHDVTEVLGSNVRRPLRCHAPQCDCVGLDEAAFARFVEEAALGEREDALMLASLLVAPRGILPLADAAGRLGLALHRAVLCQQTQAIPDPVNQTRH